MLVVGFAALGVTAIPSHALADVTNGNRVGAPISAPVDAGASRLGDTYATSGGGTETAVNAGFAIGGVSQGVASGKKASMGRLVAGDGTVAVARGSEPGVTWTFGAAAVLAGVAGVLRLARRLARR